MRYAIHTFDLVLPFSHRIKEFLYMISLLCGDYTSDSGVQGLITKVLYLTYLIRLRVRVSKATLGKECNRLDNDGGGRFVRLRSLFFYCYYYYYYYY